MVALAITPAARAATLTVTTAADSGTGSLRQAITSARSGDTIQFAAALKGAKIALATPLSIAKTLTIVGPGAAGDLVLSGRSAVRVLDVSAQGVLTATALTIADGLVKNGRGAGLNNLGSVTLDHVVVRGHRLGGTLLGLLSLGGVAIYNNGALTVRATTIQDSSDAGATASAGGGGIFNDTRGTLVLERSVVSGNSVHTTQMYGQYGGGGLCNRGAATITDTSFTGNAATGYTYGGGGAIYNDGPLAMTGGDLTGNTAGRTMGGGVLNWGTGRLTLTRTTVQGNVADQDGGGILNAGQLTVARSTISSNAARGTVYGGGGLDNMGTASIVNSTVSGNTAVAYGGGILNEDATLDVAYSTIARNGAAHGGGLYVSDVAATTELSESIVAGSTAGGDCATIAGVAVFQALTLVADGTCGATLSGDPLLGPLQLNGGGTTASHALLPGSPAIDRAAAGAETGCGVTVTVDQNGGIRPVGAGCDLGAVEAAF